MKILLLNIDSKLPNIALKKIEMYHQLQGDEVIWNMPILLGRVDKVYASCIFADNLERPQNRMERKSKSIRNWSGLYCSDLPEGTIIGGTGYDLTTKLSPEIEEMNPLINYGFTLRGCFRKCPPCLVWRSEGGLKAVGDIYSVWDKMNKWIVLFDNNPYAMFEHFEMICHQLIKESLAVDWNQGMDIRLLTLRIINLLNAVKVKIGLRFAFDSPEIEPIIREKVALLHQYYNRKYILFYVLVGFNTTFEEDLHRCNVLRELGCRSYVMRHTNTPKEKRYVRLAEWCNQFWTYFKYDFETFCIECDKR